MYLQFELFHEEDLRRKYTKGQLHAKSATVSARCSPRPVHIGQHCELSGSQDWESQQSRRGQGGGQSSTCRHHRLPPQ